tara:strand:+ start:334 stop:1158 length:825 start_codon:yes stop_codon:yes gene_type:complete
MSKLYFIDDFPDGVGGSEFVNSVVAKRFDAEFLKSDEIHTLKKDDFYILGNLSLMPPNAVTALTKLNYIILEHDYKICESRHPWRYDNSIVPKDERINYDLYKNAKAVFVQTTDHQHIFEDNDVEANFVNLESSIWSDEDLDLLEKLYAVATSGRTKWKYAVVSSESWIKNTEGSETFCKANQLDYDLILPTYDRVSFLDNLSKYSTLVFFPIARESCCRLVVEARCLGMNVITSKNYGAVLEPWFSLWGRDLIKLLRKNTERNLEKIKEYLWK